MRSLRLGALLFSLLLAGGGLAACAPGGGEAERQYAEFASSILQLRSDRANAATACLADEGFPGLEIDAGGNTIATIPTDQAEAYDAATQKCFEKVCPTCGQPMDEAAWERLYTLEVEAAKCLQDAGLEVPKAPSLQTYLDSPENERWSPHRILHQEISNSGPDLADRCPDPAAFVAYW